MNQGMTVFYCPGNKITQNSNGELKSGAGTYILQHALYSSKLGRLESTSQEHCISHYKTQSPPLQINSFIHGKVMKINSKYANIHILMIDNIPTSIPISAYLRIQDIFTPYKEGLKMQDCVRPGDIIHAQVLSIADCKSIYLTIAKSELGVLYAKSRAGFDLMPASWNEMICSSSGLLEKRKCAKPV